MTKMAGFRPKHFLWQVEGKVARVRLDRPERKNPLTFESYAELRDTFRELAMPTMSTRWCSCPTAAISARAAMCTTSSARWSPWT